MSPELHQRVRKLLDEALERPAAERVSFLEQACSGDREVFQEVSRLLGAHLESESFLQDRPTHQSDRIDRYVIKGELGHGAMGTVYEAVDPLIGRTVAVKVISLEATDPKDVEFMRDSLFREARSAGGLSHPGIVIIFDVGQENDTAFVAMERVEGPTLQKMLNGGRMADSVALDILRQAAAALDYAHQNGVVHRDVKPANIMLHKGVTVKIADFGIAKITSAQSHTRTGMVMGTPSYMSPDQIEMRPVDGRSDQFSLAVVAYEVLTGVRPFQEESLPPLLHAIIFGKRPSACAANPALPAGVDAVLERALRRLPEERYATCSEFIAALEACFPQMPSVVPLRAADTVPVLATPPARPLPPLPPLPPPPPPLAPPLAGNRSKNPLPFLLGGAAVLVLLSGLVLYKVFVPHDGDAQRRVTPPPRKIEQAPMVARFTAEPQTIEAGSAATLRWDVSGATEVTIDPDVGKVDPGGSFLVNPRSPTTYLLTAKGPGGNATARTAIGVTAVQPKPPPKELPPPPPRIPVFRAQPASLKRGERFELTWSVEGASRVAIDHGVGPVAAGGTRSLLADATATYTLTATGKGGTAKQQTTVTVAVETAGELFEEAVAARKAQQPSKAVTLFQLAANRGEPRAMLELGKVYRSGDGVAKDVKQSVSWFEKAANAGNPSGMLYMGAMYAMGEGVPRDDRQAVSWYSKAAAAGNIAGMDALGQIYLSGRGVPKDYTEAVRWFRQAAAGGNPAGMFHLGQMYEKGWGFQRDPNQALSYYRKAAAAGDKDATRRLAELRR
jgi:serine/threonine-protein kinase